ncbi:hypothetical protein [Auraticoccus monumenti]|uniref:Extensin-like protein C-terminus n=1 Tax=Auraticoccus monumenti TaxID=675864 RepID=A0A1G7EUA7_9ACTN|nr:hypothetical protein [Auraticoccus monumenti]SDE67274.1 hypothetical protein SAMN04489747_4047 [Auraticoccus monumenti]
MLTRRTLLGGAAAGAGAVVLTGCGVGAQGPVSRERPTCVARGELSRLETLGPAALVYEESGRRQSFALEPAFAEQLRAWLTWWGEHSPDGTPDELWSFGTWIDGRGDCGSWHHAGRALDVTSLRRDGEILHPGRIDRVEALPAGEQATARRRYWQLVAGLSLHFADVLSHLFDDAHRNHVHVDNGRSGSGPAVFTGRSRIQTLNVQAVCREVWQVPCELSGDWDRATREAVAAVLDPLGLPADLREEPSWRAFCTASVERGD